MSTIEQTEEPMLQFVWEVMLNLAYISLKDLLLDAALTSAVVDRTKHRKLYAWPARQSWGSCKQLDCNLLQKACLLA